MSWLLQIPIAALRGVEKPEDATGAKALTPRLSLTQEGRFAVNFAAHLCAAVSQAAYLSQNFLYTLLPLQVEQPRLRVLAQLQFP